MRTSAATTCLESAREARQRGDWRRVGAYTIQAIALAREADDLDAEGEALWLRAMAARETGGDAATMAQDLRRAIELLERAGNSYLRAHAECDVAGLAIAEGDAGQARALLDSAETTYLSLGLEVEVQRCQCGRAWTDLVAGNYAEALARVRACLPLDRAIADYSGESWTLQAGALAATFAGELHAAADFAEALLSFRRLGPSYPDLLEGHLLKYRALARAGDADAIASLRALLPSIDEVKSAALSATARVILADALLADRPSLIAYAARDEANAGRDIPGPWLVAEFGHLDRRWMAQSIWREGDHLVVDLARSGCLTTERVILDHARLEAARTHTTKIDDAAAHLSLTRRTYLKARAMMKRRLAGEGPPARRR